MKIGVLTFWESNNNYGQQLQCYALQKYLRDAGHDAYLIRYDRKLDSTTSKWKKVLNISNPVKLYKYLQHKTRVIMGAPRIRKGNDERKFVEFRGKYIKQSDKIYCYEELKESPPEADVYIVGSDQVWNPKRFTSIEKQSELYFLRFGSSSVRRISYAASFGIDKEELGPGYVNMIASFLQKFDYISVREKSGLDICKERGISNAEWVPDPTMLLNANAYRTLYERESLKKTNAPYCFFYYLGDGHDPSIKTVHDWAKSKNLDIVYVPENSRTVKYPPKYVTIPEWIYLLEHAEYVITNSYHCSVFSLIFGKKFGVILNARKSPNRFESLFEQFKIESRLLKQDFSVLDKEIDWHLVSDTFKDLQSGCKLLNNI